MRAISSSIDVHGIRYTDKMKRIERIKKVTEVEKKQPVTKTGEYESRGVSMTPQEAFRRQIAQTQNSPVYRKLQNEENKKDEKEVTEEQDTERE